MTGVLAQPHVEAGSVSGKSHVFTLLEGIQQLMQSARALESASHLQLRHVKLPLFAPAQSQHSPMEWKGRVQEQLLLVLQDRF
jgi:hypothetical protein